MDRHEWGEIVGDKGMIVDDLRWTMFQAERSIETMLREERNDKEVFAINQRRLRDVKVALAALWSKANA